VNSLSSVPCRPATNLRLVRNMLVHSDSRIPRRVLAAWQHSMLSRAWWDPIWRRKSERLRRAHGREYGAAITAVRKERKLKQTEVPGISERQLRRIEQSGDISARTFETVGRGPRHDA